MCKTVYSILEDFLLFRNAKQYLISRQSKPVISLNTKFNEVPVASDICYIHYPTYIVLKKNPQDPSLLGPVLGKNYTSSKFLHTYIKPLIDVCYCLTIRELLKCKAILFNSNFTKDIFIKYIDSDILCKIKEVMYVVHPPLMNRVIINRNRSDQKRKYITLRFKPLASCQPKAWSYIVAEVAKNFKEAIVVVVGFAKTQAELLYLVNLHNLVKTLGLNNVKIIVNASEEVKNSILSKTKVYVHMIPYEHFGIMPLEALINGANIIVHKMSGISMDIPLQEPFVIRYSKYPFDLEELLDAISLSYNSENLPAELIQEIYWQYSFDTFKRFMNKIVESVYCID
ncbi:MAG: glycosyltransferase [Candidatus Bathyarchaeia archaeon]